MFLLLTGALLALSVIGGTQGNDFTLHTIWQIYKNGSRGVVQSIACRSKSKFFIS